MIRYIFCLLVMLSSCSQEPRLEGWYLKSYYDNGWSYTTIKCDSLQMLSTT
jgi:hypothetical protein